MEGDHNSPRPAYLLDTCAIFLHNALHVDPACCPDPAGVHRVVPGLDPWQQSGGYTPQGVAGGMVASMEYRNFEVSRLHEAIVAECGRVVATGG